MYRDTPPPTLLKDYLPPEFLIDRIDLHFDLAPETTQVSAVIAFRRNPAALRGGEELRLDGEQLELIAIALDGRPLGLDEYRVTDGMGMDSGSGSPLRAGLLTLLRHDSAVLKIADWPGQ
ncbi:MAG TPA: hypothetical protein VLM84_10275, partial [Chromatiaceae bacterium]|nr:hypothetical protein [Chromatiaceae bacterium]